jgi:hypothetical protein
MACSSPPFELDGKKNACNHQHRHSDNPEPCCMTVTMQNQTDNRDDSQKMEFRCFYYCPNQPFRNDKNFGLRSGATAINLRCQMRNLTITETLTLQRICLPMSLDVSQLLILELIIFCLQSSGSRKT